MAQGVLSTPRKLEREDNRKDFCSGAPYLDRWLHQYAWQNQQASNAVTYVTTFGDRRVVGYFSLAATPVARRAVDSSFAKGRPDPIPCILLARLAVDQQAQGKGVGASLLQDAMRRVLSARETIGAAALLIHCVHDEAKSFYSRHLDCFESPNNPLQLVIPIHHLSPISK